MDPAAVPIGPASNEPSPAVLDADQPCLSCGYILRGLSRDGVCPECGVPVERSLHGDLLRYSSAEHLSLLHRGLTLIQASLVLNFLLVLGGLGMMALLSYLGLASSGVEAAMTIAGIGTGILSIWGWWWFSTPDPAFAGQESGVGARKLVRVTVIVSNLSSVAEMAFNPAPTPRPGALGTLDILSWIISIAGLIAWVVGFFAAMRYIAWLAPRLPNARALARARKLRWLGPLLSILLCVVGWLIALVLYYNLLDWVRKDLKRIRAECEADDAATAYLRGLGTPRGAPAGS